MEFTLRDSTFHSHTQLNWFHRDQRNQHQRHFNSRDCFKFASRSNWGQRENEERKKSISSSMSVRLCEILVNVFFFSFTLHYPPLTPTIFASQSFNKKKYVHLPRYLYIICEYACSRWDADFLWKCTNAFVLFILDICWMYIYFTFLIWMSCAYTFSYSNSHFRSMFWLFLAMQCARHQCLLLYQHNK